MTMRTSLRFVLPVLICTGAISACSDPIEPVDQPSEFISMRRAWLPGERAATIAQVQANGSLGFASSFAPEIFADSDSVTVVVSNPDFSARAVNGQSLLLLEPRFATSWTIAGMELLNININPVPDDTVHWIGVFWSNPAEPFWKGFVIAASTSSTVARVDVNTLAFDASGSKAGAGGGEIRPSTGTYWQANGPIGGANNDFQVTAASYGTPATVTSGPFIGGTRAAGTMQGRIQRMTMSRQNGTDAPVTSTVDYDFRAAAIGAVRVVCVFDTPCTTNAIMAGLEQQYRDAAPAARKP
jgi:hypothetical protein